MLITRFIRENRGLAAVEFALSLPILLALLMGGYEYARYLLIHVKMENIAFTISDIMTQQTAVTNGQLNQYMVAASQIMEPYSFDDGYGAVFISSVNKEVGNTQEVSWQYNYRTDVVGHERTSAVGSENAAATLPNALLLHDDETVLVTEVFYDFQPVFAGFLLNASTIYRSSVFKPRFGTLTTPPSN